MKHTNEKIIEILQDEYADYIYNENHYNQEYKMLEKMITKPESLTSLDLAEAQFIGFNHAKIESGDIKGLVQAMGLLKGEWLELKKTSTYTRLTEDEIDTINSHFCL